MGVNPTTSLLKASDGRFYGVTTGTKFRNAGGTVFTISQSGSNYLVKHTFNVSVDGAAVPLDGVIEASDGFLYGETSSGGVNGTNGVLYKVDKDGDGFVVLHQFDFTDGQQPSGGLIEGSDGLLYGTTFTGAPTSNASQGYGTVFSIASDGTEFRTLHSFVRTNSDGGYPWGLIEASDGFLYGVCAGGGNVNQYGNDYGAVFKMAKDGTGYTNIYEFNGTNGDGAAPLQSQLIEGGDGALYGPTEVGGLYHKGTIFKINKDGSGYQTLHNFTGTNSDGGLPIGTLVQIGTNLFGVTLNDSVTNNGTIFRISTDGRDFAVLHVFTAGLSDGSDPRQLTVGDDGFLYGATYYGGPANAGTIYKIDTNGKSFTVLRNFNPTGGDGSRPLLRLTGGGSVVFGVTQAGGTKTNGTIFKIDSTGSNYMILHSFDGRDGITPVGATLYARNGQLYVTSLHGGSSDWGTILQCAPDGSSFSVVHNFGAFFGDGGYPLGGLLQASNGLLYGCTTVGGSYSFGTVFRMSEDGSNYTNLFNFDPVFSGGDSPTGDLIQASDGALYGTCQYGGFGNGTVFRTDPNTGATTTISTLGSFTGWPTGPLIEGSDGRLYGTAFGAIAYYGCVYSIQKDGAGLSIIHNFPTVYNDGRTPNSPLIELANGRICGTANAGGLMSSGYSPYGTLFSMNKGGLLYSNYTELAAPVSALVRMSDGTLWTTYSADTEGIYRVVFFAELQPQAIITTNGSTVALRTSAYGLPLTYQWTKDGTLLPNATSSFTITNAQLSDAGSYSALVTNAYGSATASFTLTVLVPPSITQQPSSQTVLGGANASLSTTGIGTPAPTYSWRKNGAIISGATSTTLTVTNVARSDSGTYTVRVSNAVGAVTSSGATLTVRVPQLLSAPQQQPDGSFLLTSTDSNKILFTTNSDTANLQAQFSSNLVDWLPLPMPLVLTNGILQIQDTNVEPLRFYRIIEGW